MRMSFTRSIAGRRSTAHCGSPRGSIAKFKEIGGHLIRDATCRPRLASPTQALGHRKHHLTHLDDYVCCQLAQAETLRADTLREEVFGQVALPHLNHVTAWPIPGEARQTKASSASSLAVLSSSAFARLRLSFIASDHDLLVYKYPSTARSRPPRRGDW